LWLYAVSFERFSYLVCAVFPARPGLDGRFASQNRKMTRTPHLKYAFLIVITWEARLLLHTYGLYLCCDNLLKQKLSF